MKSSKTINILFIIAIVLSVLLYFNNTFSISKTIMRQYRVAKFSRCVREKSIDENRLIDINIFFQYFEPNIIKEYLLQTEDYFTLIYAITSHDSRFMPILEELSKNEEFEFAFMSEIGLSWLKNNIDIPFDSKNAIDESVDFVKHYNSFNPQIFIDCETVKITRQELENLSN